MLLRERVKVHHGDCLVALDTMEENSIDAVVTDPPYELGFMGRSWDASGVAFCPQTWAKVLRVMKPGAHLAAFGAPKNYHRLACAIEDAGFEIRDSLMWVFGSGFPKSLDVSKAIDKAAGAERTEVLREGVKSGASPDRDVYAKGLNAGFQVRELLAPATDAARQWQGWGTALKPAYEPVVLARKPLSEKTVAANVLRWGTGAINIDATRIDTGEELRRPSAGGDNGLCGSSTFKIRERRVDDKPAGLGRWPANLAHDGSDEVLAGFPYSKSSGGKGEASQRTALAGHVYGDYSGKTLGANAGGLGDEGSAARFFYCAKASKSDRAGSRHPTVKPVSLMRWLCRMITPPNGVILDPFGGSGTTGQAAYEEGFEAVLIEREAEYVADIQRRMESVGLV